MLPSLLPIEEPDHGFDPANALAFRFVFDGLLPPHVLQRLVVRRHAEIAGDGAHVWRTGAVFSARHGLDARALVEAKQQDRRIDLFVKGPDATEYLGVLRDEIRGALDAMPDLPVEEQIRLDPDMAEEREGRDRPTRPDWGDYETVHAAHRESEKTVRFGKHVYLVDRILKNAPVGGAARTGEVFISYSHADRDLAERLAARLERASVSVWWDRYLLPGDLHDSVLADKVDAAKAVVVIWTDKSRESGYVIGEAKRADAKLIGLHGPKASPETAPLPFEHSNITPLDDFDALIEALRAKTVDVR